MNKVEEVLEKYYSENVIRLKDNNTSKAYDDVFEIYFKGEWHPFNKKTIIKYKDLIHTVEGPEGPCLAISFSPEAFDKFNNGDKGEWFIDVQKTLKLWKDPRESIREWLNEEKLNERGIL